MSHKPVRLIIQRPSFEEMLEALAIFRADTRYADLVLTIDTLKTEFLSICRPGVIVLSALNQEQAEQTLKFLKMVNMKRISAGLPARDPCLRFIVCTHEAISATLVWQEVGVHEVILAPVTSANLQFRIQRHATKAIKKYLEEITAKGKPLEEIIEEASHEKVKERVTIPIKEVKGRMSVSSFRSPNPNWNQMMFFEQNQPTIAPRFQMELKGDLFTPEKGEWKSVAPPVSGFEEAWEWKPSPEEEKTSGLCFRGEKPSWNPSKKTWTLESEDPAMWNRKESLLSVSDVRGDFSENLENPLSENGRAYGRSPSLENSDASNQNINFNQAKEAVGTTQDVPLSYDMSEEEKALYKKNGLRDWDGGKTLLSGEVKLKTDSLSEMGIQIKELNCSWEKPEEELESATQKVSKIEEKNPAVFRNRIDSAVSLRTKKAKQEEAQQSSELKKNALELNSENEVMGTQKRNENEVGSQTSSQKSNTEESESLSGPRLGSIDTIGVTKLKKLNSDDGKVDEVQSVLNENDTYKKGENNSDDEEDISELLGEKLDPHYKADGINWKSGESSEKNETADTLKEAKDGSRIANIFSSKEKDSGMKLNQNGLKDNQNTRDWNRADSDSTSKEDNIKEKKYNGSSKSEGSWGMLLDEENEALRRRKLKKSAQGHEREAKSSNEEMTSAKNSIANQKLSSRLELSKEDLTRLGLSESALLENPKSEDSTPEKKNLGFWKRVKKFFIS